MSIERIQKKSGIIGRSDSIQQVLEMILQVSPVDISVLITGESGTGKEMIAKALHQNSKRSHESLVTVNCGAIPEGIIESELFGHKKGAYTDARDDRKGYFETANKGTIFLDEIGETPLETQVKLLRVLESGEFMPVGASKSKKTDVRVIAATNKDLASLVSKEKFRQDLYYRLKTVTIDSPPLRNRVEDIGLLVERFALEFTRSNDMLYRGFMPESIRTMKNFSWNGNVRELKNFVESIIVLEKGERITVDMVEKQLGMNKTGVHDNTALPVVVPQPAESAERELILRQLFLLRQDVEFLKQVASEGSSISSHVGVPVISKNSGEVNPSLHIEEDVENFIKNSAIGDITMEDLEREVIERTLKYFNNNRRASAKSLNMSERTLYRKIDQYGLERKIKLNE
ncbi:MAG: sigma-54-dependent Fis family transcriptional regulator [Candidatus Marinimicrobia bacterium]|jgi:DNA-binding NtrC family response regulator|nr:sigma-54-dependent Fis family transcriptional regulator [Candidatus Neomarinimicrobiota bacterium]MBT4149963.1 sigma-54-dependent Fis family transcriptional regulator [Candidatus Neomarinimicrobiota bacterium]MBT4785307.1 sigma-54-dependent Fis family transcriptional regulator [Candidatus Neomarinimicrobiota bacterium]MBT5440813.1 sigma-54-dependent Fis family transcriptional regulator [Candidatus Neomarinimicrobiota bacterium]MBT7422681.1 sigma-54-dependent Fis family transcriptional regula